MGRTVKLNTMEKILIFGSLPSGFGGMENVFNEFSNFFNQEKNYSISFYMYELNQNNDYNWLSTLNYQVYRPSSSFRLIQKIKIKKHLVEHILSHEPALIIAYDPLSVYLARKALTTSKLAIPLLSWLHFSFSAFKTKYQHYTLKADYHLALCESIKQQLIKKGAPEETIFVIYNPVWFQKKVIHRPKEGNMKLLYMGRVQFKGQKNLQELFNALALMEKKFTLHIVGNGPEEEIEKLKSLADQHHISDRIVWHGWQKKPWDYVKTSIETVTALVLTSSFEGFPMTLCEALSYGIFCISSNCPTGPNDIIDHTNGLLYDLGEIAALSNCFNLLYFENKLPCQTKIKESINHLYRDQYFKNVKCVISSILLS